MEIRFGYSSSIYLSNGIICQSMLNWISLLKLFSSFWNNIAELTPWITNINAYLLNVLFVDHQMVYQNSKYSLLKWMDIIYIFNIKIIYAYNNKSNNAKLYIEKIKLSKLFSDWQDKKCKVSFHIIPHAHGWVFYPSTPHHSRFLGCPIAFRVHSNLHSREAFAVLSP